MIGDTEAKEAREALADFMLEWRAIGNNPNVMLNEMARFIAYETEKYKKAQS
jgi:hypothetical protein